ncbi:MAG: glycosyltransferase, partial [Trueperella pyogenes]|nr:glycosyltransferase [Trueperella pyogenes]
MTPAQSVEPSPSQKVAAIICAHNVGRQIASTVRACRAIPGVDLLIVIDDG